MKYEVVLELTHDFKIDCQGLCDWADTNLDLKMTSRNDGEIVFAKDGELTSTDDEDFKSDEHKQLIEYYNALDEADELIALALPSRLEGQAYSDWVAAKKATIVAVTDYSTLSSEQKKLWMGLELTSAEKDALGA